MDKESVNQERALLGSALTTHMMSNLPFSVAFELFQRYCRTEAQSKVNSLDADGLAKMRAEFEEMGIRIPEPPKEESTIIT